MKIKTIVAIALAVMTTVSVLTPAAACPAGTHPYGGTGSHHAGGGCS
jgi:hypothetical protein